MNRHRMQLWKWNIRQYGISLIQLIVLRWSTFPISALDMYMYNVKKFQ